MSLSEPHVGIETHQACVSVRLSVRLFVTDSVLVCKTSLNFR